MGLLAGAVILGLMIPNAAPTRIIDVTLRTFLLGALFLFPIAFAIGYPTMRILTRREASKGTIILTAVTLAAVIALLLALVLGTFSGSFWLATIGVFPAVGLCTATAVALGRPSPSTAGQEPQSSSSPPPWPPSL